MPLSIDDITKEIELMNEGKKNFYKIHQFASQEDLDQAYEFLSENQFDFGIRVDEHTESTSGLRSRDVIIVTKR